MKTAEKISPAVIHRLPRYRRILAGLRAKGVERISSNALSEVIGYTASQIRQDLNNFGGFGQQGYGYNVRELYLKISAILGVDKPLNLVLVGMGSLGKALFNAHFTTEDLLETFRYRAAFDHDPDVIGTTFRGIEVSDSASLPDYLAEHHIDIGVISAGPNGAQEIADTFVAGGIKGIWSFSPDDIDVPGDVALLDVHLRESLLELAYYTKGK
jgi:redox-sensing transcriptional repressor